MHEPPLQRVAADIRTVFKMVMPDEDIPPIYIGRKPDSESKFVSVARGASQGLLHGYGGLAYLYTTVEVTVRDVDYENMETLMLNTVSALLVRSDYQIMAFSPPQTVRGSGEKIESMEMSFTTETVEKI